ncbi:MAG TPA: [protein-PII] uridylyltransferase [Pirellulaceae bacterium]|nr:[protein-PII] uridylyltransferase [Pirellulaceae bacterium]
MTTLPRISPAVVAAKEELARGREKLKKQHDGGSPGIQVCNHFATLLEEIVLSQYEGALAELPAATRAAIAPHVALVAHSGFGRREMAPYSDVDVMLLHGLASERDVLPLVRPFSQSLYDLGLDVGYSTRTPQQACQGAISDATIFTALTESRLLIGNEDLFARFSTRFRRLTRSRWRQLVTLVEAARKEERSKYGETVFLLEPNIKRSRGALRDVQLIRWLGFTRYGENEPEMLRRAGHLTRQDQRRLHEARDFLLWLRNDLHFAAGKASDVLERTEQVRLAECRGYEPVAGLMPVELFMREYFRHTTAVREIAAHFAASVRPRATLRRVLEPLLSHQVEGDFRVGPTEITATRRGLVKVASDLGQVLRLLDLANYYDRRIAHETWEAIRSAMSEREPADPSEPLAPEVAERFLSLMSQPMRLSELLRRLHELRVLEQIVPGMNHARGLLQFNAYHRYTVDEHSIRAVDRVTQLQTDPGLPGELYRNLKQKRILHLAALIHDLGKGYVEDHSDVGRLLAEQLGHRLGLPPHECEQLMFLVHKHLRMSHLAQQHDIHDENVVVQFAVEVGSSENLQLLYLLTLADLAAVGPGVLNEWKQELLTDLYEHTVQLLASDSPADASNQRLVQRRAELQALIAGESDADWWQSQIAALPGSSLFTVEPQRIVAELRRLKSLPHQDAFAAGRFVPQRNVVEYTVGTYEEITPGIFHRLTGALASQRQQILSAEINTLADGLVLDRFYVQDSDYAGPPPEERLAQTTAALVAALKDSSNRPPQFVKRWQDLAAPPSRAINHLPTNVRVDNSTAERYTILTIFAYDRMGLLYTISRTLFELELSVCRAKIGTRLDQVVDVFYVTDKGGRKIEDEPRLAAIRQRLLAAMEGMEQG